MGLPNRVTDKNRQSLRLDFAGGSAALRFWAFQGNTGSADGDSGPTQYASVFNFRTVRAAIYATNDMGATIVGIHLNRNIAPVVTQTVTAGGADQVTQFSLLPANFQLGQELGVSIDPANDPGVAYLILAIENDSP